MEKDLIVEKLEEHDKKFNKVDLRLDKHDDKIEILEKSDAINGMKLEHLYTSMDKLTNTLKWSCGFFIAGIVTGTVSLAVFIIEKLIK